MDEEKTGIFQSNRWSGHAGAAGKVTGESQELQTTDGNENKQRDDPRQPFGRLTIF